jgi:hypothetical protein
MGFILLPIGFIIFYTTLLTALVAPTKDYNNSFQHLHRNTPGSLVRKTASTRNVSAQENRIRQTPKVNPQLIQLPHQIDQVLHTPPQPFAERLRIGESSFQTTKVSPSRSIPRA